MNAEYRFHAEVVPGFDPGTISHYRVGHIIVSKSGPYAGWFFEPQTLTPEECRERFGGYWPDRIRDYGIDERGSASPANFA